MADHVPVYHFDVNAEAQYAVGAAGLIGASIYEMYNAWEPRDNIIFLHFFLFLVGSFYFARHLPFMLRTEFLRLGEGGITFRDLGFVAEHSENKLLRRRAGISTYPARNYSREGQLFSARQIPGQSCLDDIANIKNKS